MSIVQKLTGVAEGQLGLVTRQQALEAGATRHQVDQALAEKWLVPVRRGVFRLEGTETSWAQEVMGATLVAGLGAIASHRSAGTLLGFPGLARRVEVTLPMFRTSTAKGLIVHRTRFLTPEDWTMHGPIPITSPARTIVDLSQVVLPFAVANALGHALSQRLMSRDELVDRMRALRSCGHRDLGMLTGLLDERPGNKREMQGDFELHLFDALKEAGLPLPVPQYRILRDDGTPAFVDFAYPDILLALEADSYTWHASFEAWARDHMRNTELIVRGWGVLPVTYKALMRNPRRVAENVRRAREARLALLASR